MSLRCWAVILFVQVIAERGRIQEKALELDAESPSKRSCPQWAALQLVLKKLRIEELEDPFLDGRIEWTGCNVEMIDLANLAIEGSLDEHMGEFISLKNLDLHNTRVSGNLTSLQAMTQLKFIDLENSNVAGDLSSLRSMTELQGVYLRNSGVTGDLSSIRMMTQLKYPELEDAQIAGDLESLHQLTRLQKLHLGSTEVSGDLSSLQHLTQLQELFLSSTEVAGELSSLSRLTQLRKMYLGNTKMAGNLSALQAMTQLEHLEVSDTKVQGDLSSLQTMTQLKYLDLGNTKVAGDLFSLHDLRELTAIDFINTKVAGDLSHLQAIARLEHLDLANTNVGGDLSSLQTATQLEYLDLGHSKVTGDLYGLRTVTQLTTIDLTNTTVAGDLSHLQAITPLEYLDLAETNVAGDLSSLHRMNKLERLYLDGTEVVGDLSSLETLTELQELFLNSTAVTGDLSNLQALSKLQELSLSNTNIAGDLSSLQTCTQLQKLYVESVEVAGDVSILHTLTKLQELFLSNTKVDGDLSSHYGLTQLQKLHLGSTRVFGELASLVYGLTQLQELSLSNTEVLGDLSSLQRMTQLEKLYLDETEIVGRLSSFSKLIRLEELFLRNTGVQGELSSLRKLRKLQKLYLGNTKVAGELSGLEKMTQLKYLELSNAKVAGDLSSLQGLSQLHGVFLSHTKVTGDLSGLQNLTQLKQFFLSGTDIVGDLSGLQRMLQLERIDLDNTQIGGDISSLQRIQMLHYLILDNTKVSGNVSCLHSLSRLEHLGLENTKVGGNLLSLHTFTRLRELMLSNTPITGELSNLQTCSQLQVLDLSGIHVAGDLSSLRSFQAQHLETLVLSNTEVQGDLSSLQTMTQLKVLDLGNSKVAGDLRGLRTITELTALDLTSTKVAGDLSHLKTAAQLRFLDLANTKVAGNLSSLHQLTELEKLYLDSTEVVGDLSSLQTLSELQELFLSSTEAAGDLSNLQKIKYLEYLVLDNTKVSGDLSGLQTMAFLESLDLRGTAISGDVSSLKTLTQLQHLYLANTEVVGDLSVILHWHHIKTVDLSHTSVSGQLTAHWRGHALELRTFKLSHSQAKFVPTNEDLLELRVYYTSSGPDFLSKAVLPQLNVLELSGCPLHSQIGDLLLPLSACPVLTSIKAANCGLFGVLPSLKLASAQVDGITWTTWESPLLQSLLTWDLSSNKLDHVEAIPGNVQVLMLAGNPALSFADGVLRKAVTAGVFLDLQNVTLTNSTEIEELLEERVLTKTPELFSVNLEGGYSCYSIMSKSLHITPEKLLPQDLCRCSPGFEGTAVNCKKCPGNTFKRSYSGICKTCPEGSEPEGGISCRCTFGDMVERAGVYSCPECRAGQASNGTSDEIHSYHKSENCIPCHNSHLVCADPGMLLWLAPPEEGFARLKVNDTLALPCLPPKKSRCNSTSGKGSAHPECAKGYRGILCSDCAAHHYLSNKICEPCRSGDMLPDHWQVAVAISAALALAAPFALVFLTLALVWVRHKPRWPAIGPWKDQLLIQAPILLQTCQLWAVLALLMKGEGQQGDAILPNWDLPYIEVLQFSVASLKGALNLQCKFDGAMIRLGFGLMAPVAPVLVVLCCLGMEVIDHGFGIAAALKALTLFYVGGASSTFKLLSCQRVDGERVSLPNEFAFRKWLPHLRCHDPSLSLVDTMGYVSAFCYGVLVPCALAYLYARQHLALLPGKMMMAPSVKDGNDGALEIRLAELSSCSWEKMLVKDQEGTLKRRLVAASAAHIAVLIRGRALVQLKDGAAIVMPSAGASGRSTEAHTSGGSNEQLQVGDVLNFMGAELDTKGTIKCRELAEAMMDRCLLEEAEASERALAGSKNILFKYARCRSIYMEIIQKLVAVALVSVVGSENGLEMSLTIILLMAAASAMVQPFLLPQVNVLQCGCFLCLAFAALSFSYQNAWLSRVALAAPFLLSAVLALRPDSTEGLAARIWQQLKETTDLEDGKPVEVIAETYAFL